MRLKPGVQAAALHPSIEHALNIADLLWTAQLDEVLVVTSLHDSRHSATSLHYGAAGDVRCRAADLRTRNLEPEDQELAVGRLRTLLGTAYDVVLESDHIHIEYDPDL